ncbi:hypothetical protein GCM10027038_40280 [Arthrobacter bambusae]
MGSHIGGRVQPIGVNSLSDANAAHDSRLSTVTTGCFDWLRAARNCAAATVATATAPVASPVTSKAARRTARGPLVVSWAACKSALSLSAQIVCHMSEATSAKLSFTLTILDGPTRTGNASRI